MNAKLDTSDQEQGALTGARVTSARSRPTTPRGSGIAGAIRAIPTAGLALNAATCAGCATSNYEFDALPEQSGHSWGARLLEALEPGSESARDRELYDIDVIPLARTQLHLFAEADDEGGPVGFVEADVDAHLPLSGFVEATVNRYGSDRRMNEHHEYGSYLRELFQEAPGVDRHPGRLAGEGDAPVLVDP